jgi:hypothetical protein
MTLHKFQEQFKELMLRPRNEIANYSDVIAAQIHDNDISVNDRLGVYHNNIIGSLSNSLCATFPMIENLVGVDFLKDMSRQFIFQNPPSSGCLHHYGIGFDEFIKGYKPAKSLPYLPDVARLEIALHHAYYAEDDEPLAADALAQIPPEALCNTTLHLRNSASLIQSTYPLHELYKFCNKNGGTPDLSTHVNCSLLVHRPKLEVLIMPINPDEYFFLTLLQNHPLGVALEGTIEERSDFDFTAFLQKHIYLESFSKNALD